MNRRPPRSTRTDTLLPYPDALPICELFIIDNAIVGHETIAGYPHRSAGSRRRPPYEGVLLDDQRSCPWRASRAPHTSIPPHRSEEHTSELQSLMRISYAVFCL